MSEEKVEQSDALTRKIDLLMSFRGYTVENEVEGRYFKDLIVSTERGERYLLLRVVHRTPLVSGKVGVHYVRKMKEKMRGEGYERGLLIGQGFSYSARKEARARAIETIEESKIPAFNIFSHHLVPKHEILPKEESKELLKKYHVEPHQLPWIRKSDPAVFLIGARPGDIIRITRHSPTAGVHVTYRHVV